MTYPENLDDLPTVNAVQLAAFLGLTDERIRQLANQGVITKVARGAYDLRRSVLQYVVWIREAKAKRTGTQPEGDGEGPGWNYDNERARLTRAKAERAEIETSVIMGRVHEAAAVEATWMDSALAARSKLLGVPSKAAPQIDPSRAAEIQILLTDLISDALTELADYDSSEIALRTNPKRLFAGLTAADGASVETAAEVELESMGGHESVSPE